MNLETRTLATKTSETRTPNREPCFTCKGMECYEPLMHDMIALWREIKDYHRCINVPKITRMNDYLVLDGIWLPGNAQQQLVKAGYPDTQRSLIWLYTKFRAMALRYDLKPVIIGRYFFNALIGDRLSQMRSVSSHEHEFYRARHPDLINKLSILPITKSDALYVISGVRY